jgi:hypothetical protein
MRRKATLLVALAGTAMALPAAPAHAAGDAMTLVAPVLAPMLPGQQGWVSTMWTTTAAVCNVRATASGTGLKATYPTNTSTFASLYKSDTLEAGQIDYTAFNLAVDTAQASGTAMLTISLTYTERNKSNNNPGNDNNTENDDKGEGTPKECIGPQRKASVTASVPIVAATGEAVVQKTSTVTVTRSTPVWTQIAFQAGRTGLADFRVSLDAPAGLSVVYPGEKTSAGLNLSTSLAVGHDDFVAVRFDAADLAPGSYDVPVRATYAGGTFTGTLKLVVT